MLLDCLEYREVLPHVASMNHGPLWFGLSRLSSLSQEESSLAKLLLPLLLYSMNISSNSEAFRLLYSAQPCHERIQGELEISYGSIHDETDNFDGVAVVWKSRRAMSIDAKLSFSLSTPADEIRTILGPHRKAIS